MTRDEFIQEISSILNKIITEKSLDAWFFNWAPNNLREKRKAEHELNRRILGNWEFITISSNGTNVGTGWFKNSEYALYLELNCWDKENEEAIDDFDIYKIENCPISFSN